MILFDFVCQFVAGFFVVLDRARFNLFFGTAMEALCQLRNDDVSNDESVMICLKTAQKVLELDWSKLAMCNDPRCPREILNIMHRIVLTRENPLLQQEALQVVRIVLQAATDFIQQESRKKVKDAPGDGQTETTDNSADSGEGGTFPFSLSFFYLLFEFMEKKLSIFEGQHW